MSDQLKRLKLYARKWQSYLNLRDWSVIVSVGSVDDDDNAAETTWDAQNRVALINVDENISEFTEKQMDQLMLHEMLEIRLSGLRDMAAAYDRWDQADKEAHIVIRALESLLL